MEKDILQTMRHTLSPEREYWKLRGVCVSPILARSPEPERCRYAKDTRPSLRHDLPPPRWDLGDISRVVDLVVHRPYMGKALSNCPTTKR